MRRLLLIALTGPLLVGARVRAQQEPIPLEPVVIEVPRQPFEPAVGSTVKDPAELQKQRASASDAASLLQGIAGVSLAPTGGLSSLPAIHGLADDRLRVQVAGADLVPACPNHMNAPLSYADPGKVAKVQVFTGSGPVSAGGDSIGGTVRVDFAPPVFARPGEKFVADGQAGTFFRSNGAAWGYGLEAGLAIDWLRASYSQSGTSSGDVAAGRSFKPAAPGREGGPTLAADLVGSSAYQGSVKRELDLALQRDAQLVQVALSRQTVGSEAFPNQRMDMTGNDNWLLNLHYAGSFSWGELDARATYQDTQHTMDMGADRFSYGTGMPMNTKAKTRGASVQARFPLSEGHLLRTGAELQYHTLYDWWPPVGGTMGPNAFWNVDYGQRLRLGAYAEWEARWSDRWTTLAGLRSDTVTTDAAPVQGYDNGLAGSWGNDAVAFNAKSRARTDPNWDASAQVRFSPGPSQSYEAGYGRKSRSPSLYQRYPWSTNGMAALMNNLVGDGNGYLGRVDLRPEVAHDLSLAGEWRDADSDRWRARVSVYYTHIDDYIDAGRCGFGQCSAANLTATSGFVLLQYVNQPARLYGADLSGQLVLLEGEALGSFSASAVGSVVRGANLSTGDNLCGVMPPTATVALNHRLGSWSASADLLLVADKDRVSQVRNELRTGGYGLVNLRASYEWKHARVDLSAQNLLDRAYASPLGGAYVGQGPSMSVGGIPWGVPVPGPGRSVDVAFKLRF